MSQANHVINYFQGKIIAVIELKTTNTAEEKSEISNYLSKSQLVKPTSIVFVSKEEGLLTMKKEFGDIVDNLGLNNPLNDVYKFNLIGKYANSNHQNKLKEDILKLRGANQIYFQQQEIGNLLLNRDRIFYIFVIISGILILISSVLIHNTIRLSMYSKRFIIKNMELVGATNQYIARPFLVQAAIHGFIGFLIAAALLAGFIYLIIMKMPEINSLIWETNIWVYTLGITLFSAGVILSVVSTYLAVQKFLNRKIEDLY
jgi:cell division transport system permease protein